jgi:hypothetical protein
MNFNDFGTSTVKDSTAFKKIQYFSKTNPQSLYTNISDFSTKYKKIANLYLNDTLPSNTSSYGTLRQHNYSSLSSTTNSFNSLLDQKSLNRFLEYNNDLDTTPQFNNTTFDLVSRGDVLKTNSNSIRMLNSIDTNTLSNNQSLNKFMNYPTVTSLLDAENDAKHIQNPFKYLLANK